MSQEQPCRIVTLISGRGSNLQAILEHCAKPQFPARVCAVISNRPAAAGLERAANADVETVVIDHKKFSERYLFEQQLQQQIDAYQPDIVVLAGFMRMLGTVFVNHYLGRLLNIHPSLLPKFPGLDTHARVLAATEVEHGASVHFVTAELDGGPVIAQTKVPVLPTDTAEQLATRVLRQEHKLYPYCIRYFAEGRLRLHQQQVLFDDKILTQPLLIT